MINSAKFNVNRILVALMVIALATALIAGCQRSRQARDVKVTGSGFLPDYSLLTPKDPAVPEQLLLLRYLNPEADWPNYQKILLDPVILLSRSNHTPDEIPRADLQLLADSFYKFLYDEFSKDFEMVKEVDPRTMRFQAALTNVEQSWGAIDVITGFMPAGVALSTVHEFATGKPLGVGEVSAEAKITDAQTGKVLLMAVDRRVGGKTIKDTIDTWEDARRILQIWSKIARFRLCEFRGGKGCLAPADM